MAQLQDIVGYLNTFLDLKRFPNDPSSNGLQVEASREISTIVYGVDACQDLFDVAKELKADLVCVHHGLFWRGMPYPLTGMHGERIRFLMCENMSLYGVHLPLDAHPEVGNNAVLADVLKLKNRTPFFAYAGEPIGVLGTLPRRMVVSKIADVFKELAPELRLFGDATLMVSSVAIVSGGGGTDSILEAVRCGADLLVTGEFEHQSFHVVQELKIPVLALGHYASETVGISALCEFMAHQFPELLHVFADLPTTL